MSNLSLYNPLKPDENIIAPFQTLFGIGVPASILGADGDIYFQYTTSSSDCIYKKVSGNWQLISGGEANTISSLGAGHSVYASKVGVDLRLKSLVAGLNMTITEDASTITFTGPTPGEINTASNLGSGSQLFASKSGLDFRFRTLTAGTNISLTQNANDIVISATGGVIGDGTNLGTGSQVFKAAVGANLVFRTLVAGSGITMGQGTDEITISASGESNTGANLGSGSQLYASKSGVNLQFRSIVAGSNITVSQSSTEITISTSGVGEANTGANVGIGTGQLFRDKTSTTLNFKTLVAGTNVSIVNGADTITINATGGGSGLTSLNGLTSNTQTFVNDSNITITSSVSTHTIGWTGTLAMARGGSGANITATLGGIIYSTATTMAVTSAGTTGQVLTSNGAAAPTRTTLAVGEVNTATNLGSGEGVFAAKVGANLQFKSLIAGTNVTLSSDGNGITINAAGGAGEVNTASNLGAGTGVFASKSGVDLRFKSFVAGTNVTLSNDANTITINATGGGGGHETQLLSFDSGNIVIKATGTTADLALITASKDFTIASTSRLILNRPTSVLYSYIHVTFMASETTGRTVIQIDQPEPHGFTTGDISIRPLAYRLNATYATPTAGTVTYSGGTVSTVNTAFTAGQEQKVVCVQ